MLKAKIEAEHLLRDLGISDVPICPKNVCELMSSNSYPIKFTESPLSSEAILGISIGNARGAEILVNSNIGNRHRKRFTAAHEIGHVSMHILPGKKSSFECLDKDISASNTINNTFEKEANYFASSLLMPHSSISSLVKISDLTWALIRQIQTLCDVSLEAAARRTIEISKDACCLIIHKDDVMWNPVKSQSFSIFVPNQPFSSDLHAVSIEELDMHVSEQFEECQHSDWSVSNNTTGKLFYSSIHSAEHNRTMTLLSHVEDAEYDDNVEWPLPHFLY